MSQLPTDCLNAIFEYLEDDKATLHSCILVNRFWCVISVRFFWSNVSYYRTSNFRTLISCLPNESKEILFKNGIIISTPTPKPPIFNYASFCKVLSIDHVHNKLKLLLSQQSTRSPSQNFNNNLDILVQEIFKLFVKQIPSLKN